MNRRNWLRGAGAAGIVASLPLNRVHGKEAPSAPYDKANFSSEIKRLDLRHTWTTDTLFGIQLTVLGVETLEDIFTESLLSLRE